jgi:broad specificity phosphatase PhoE
MNFQGYIEEVRKKPEQERHKLVLIIAGGITLVILLMWLVNLKMTVFNGNSEETVAADKTESPFTLIKENFSNLIDSIKQSWQ